MAAFNPENDQHLRFNPLSSEWVLVCPHRMKRPWQGQTEDGNDEEISKHDPNNPLCPGSTRSSGKITDNYTSTYTFDNDFPALSSETPEVNEDKHPLFRAKTAQGACKVVCFHPHSDVTLPVMSITEIRAVISEWMHQYHQLAVSHRWVQIFENKGAAMGCSNMHPHCQIWASSFLPSAAEKEDEAQRSYLNKYGKNMLMEYAQLEASNRSRVVAENTDWLCVVPYWAVWPFELLLIAKKSTLRISDLDPEQQINLAKIMKEFLTKYDNLFRCSFPYSMGWHNAPSYGDSCDGDGADSSCCHWQLHAHYYPPLLRSANVKKFLVGYEMLAQPQRDVTAEKAAEMLRNLPDMHYKESVSSDEVN